MATIINGPEGDTSGGGVGAGLIIGIIVIILVILLIFMMGNNNDEADVNIPTDTNTGAEESVNEDGTPIFQQNTIINSTTTTSGTTTQ